MLTDSADKTTGLVPPPGGPVTSIDGAVDRMRAIAEYLPEQDGLACFNRMYLGVTVDVKGRVQEGFFENPPAMEHLDVVFANFYFEAVDALTLAPSRIPAAWAPLMQHRSDHGITAIQFALAGMNAHINHDLPLAVVRLCEDLHVTPHLQDQIHRDFVRVNELLDAAERTVRQSFESGPLLTLDESAHSLADPVCNWTMNSAREVAWTTAQALWEVREIRPASDLLANCVAEMTAAASRCLLVAPPHHLRMP
jgi:hypothetical protein